MACAHFNNRITPINRVVKCPHGVLVIIHKCHTGSQNYAVLPVVENIVDCFGLVCYDDGGLLVYLAPSSAPTASDVSSGELMYCCSPLNALVTAFETVQNPWVRRSGVRLKASPPLRPITTSPCLFNSAEEIHVWNK